MGKKVFAFDLGKASIGYCVREDATIKEVNSIIVDKDHGEIISQRDRRRVERTLLSHRAREVYFNKIWKDCGLKPFDKEDIKFKKEFAKKDDDTIYTSCLLRILLLQNKKLAEWQIYKALHNAFQKRGYDTNIAWKSSYSDDDKENIALVEKYTQKNGVELINSEEYKYPCYYDALNLGLWEENTPHEFKRFIPQENSSKFRVKSAVAPRILVEKELIKLWQNAQKQLPQLEKYCVEEFLYGDYFIAYGSFYNPELRKFMGTERDWQGVLGQKIPRFDNRIISKCKLLPKRNVCKANTLENVSLVLLMKLKNLRVTSIYGEKIRLNPDEIKIIYENWLEKSASKNNRLDVTITKAEIEDVIGQKISDKIEPMKANISGRSSFCRRACQIMIDIIIEGELYPETIDVSKYIDPAGTKNGITETEIKTMLSKIGDWNNLYIPDNRDENAQMADSTREKTDIMIGNITNPIVRNRLQIFRDLLSRLYLDYGKPDEVIFEFIREGADNSLYGKAKAQAAEATMNKNFKDNEKIKEELESVNAYDASNFEKLKLLKMQGGKCVYSGKPIAISNFGECEIDHIYPRTMGGNDALYNRVLCYRIENQKKAGRTPYEWLSQDETNWTLYVKRLSDIKQSLGKKKFELLTSKPEDCEKLIDSYNGLAETSHIARVAQQITAFTFGWGLQVEGEKRHIFVNNGSTTAAIRKRYGLNSLLGNDFKKNRENDKHHALDAICISYSRDFKYDKSSGKDIIMVDGFNTHDIAKAIETIIPYPYSNKKPFKGNTKPLETIYGLRTYGDKSYITQRVELISIKPDEKNIRKIIDEVIKSDLIEKLALKPTNTEWVKMLETYIHPKKKTFVKKVMIIVSEGPIERDSNGRERIGEFADFGTKGVKHQMKHSKGHRGQILYYTAKGTVKVMPVYANKSIKDVTEKLQEMGCKLYNGGQMFYSGCLIDVPNEFKAGKETYPAGVYKLRTVMANTGAIKLENNNGIEILTSATYLAQAKFSKYKC